MRKAHAWTVITAAAILGLAGCGGGTKSSASHPIGDAGIRAADVVAQTDSSQQPLDAAPSPDGSVIYYVASGDRGPSVYSVPAGGGSRSTVVDGAPLVKPTGVAVATDGKRLYIADEQARPPIAAAGSGGILAIPAQGPGGPALVPGTQGRAPRGLDVVNSAPDSIYFTGIDPTNGAPGVFQVPSAGGTVSTIAEGTPFTSPDSVVVSSKGVAYVTDQGSGPGQGKVFRVSGGTIEPVLTNLRLGQPAGVTLINNDTTLLVSSIDAASQSDQVLFLDLPTGKTAAATKVIGANKNSSGGLHRAYQAAVLAWADVSRSGRVYRVEP